jgi:hypothetical protein
MTGPYDFSVGWALNWIFLRSSSSQRSRYLDRVSAHSAKDFLDMLRTQRDRPQVDAADAIRKIGAQHPLGLVPVHLCSIYSLVVLRRAALPLTVSNAAASVRVGWRSSVSGTGEIARTGGLPVPGPAGLPLIWVACWRFLASTSNIGEASTAIAK